MITIGIDASRANVAQRTGTEWYCYHLLQQLKTIIPETGYRVILYTKEPLRSDLLPLPRHWNNHVLRWPPKLLWTQLRLSISMLAWWKRPDVLFIPAHTIPIIHPKRTVYVAHDLGFERFPELYANQFIGGKLINVIVRIVTFGRYGASEGDYHRWSMRFAVTHAKTIIAISEFTRSELTALYAVPKQQIAVVHNGFSGDEYNVTDQLKSPSAIPYLLYIGRIEDKKNIKHLIEGFSLGKHHWPHQLWLVGQPGHGYPDICKTINQLGLAQSVRQFGYVNQSLLPQMMQAATAFVFTPNYEGFGIPILEALASGTPVICSDIPALREIGGNACHYVNHQDPQAIYQAMTEVIELSTTERQRRQKLGWQRVTLFSWKKCAQKTWQVLTTVLHE